MRHSGLTMYNIWNHFLYLVVFPSLLILFLVVIPPPACGFWVLQPSRPMQLRNFSGVVWVLLGKLPCDKVNNKKNNNSGS